MPAARGPIWIIGLPGSGKTTVGRLLARRLRRPFVDLDRRVETAAGMRVARIFARHGEAAFRRLEADALAAVAAEKPPPVVACGAGVVTRKRNRERLAAGGTVLWLDLPLATALSRCRGEPGVRPLLAVPETYRRRLRRRLLHYRRLGRRVDADAAPAEVARRARARLARG